MADIEGCETCGVETPEQRRLSNLYLDEINGGKVPDTSGVDPADAERALQCAQTCARGLCGLQVGIVEG